jgi:hypothetical protein
METDLIGDRGVALDTIKPRRYSDISSCRPHNLCTIFRAFHQVYAIVANLLKLGSPREAAAVSEALRVIGNEAVLQKLIEIARQSEPPNWALATLGRLSPLKVRTALQEDDPLVKKLEPLFLMSSEENWLASDTVDVDLKFLLKQNL